MSPILRNRPEDIWTRVAHGGEDECWPYLEACNNHGYGQFRLAGRTVPAHRLAFEVATGIDPAGYFVCHSCDNPPCCNPAHLFLGSALDNNRDCKAKGRNAAGERHPCSKLTVAQVREIRRRRAAGEQGKVLAAEFGVTPALVSLIILRRIWLLA